MPRVSIGLPVYNGENFVKEALDSLLAQTYKDFELLISDNASTDETQIICKAYAAKDRRVRYFRNDRNIGAAPNFNRLFRLATGEYFKWAHHDDMCAPEYLERCVDVLDHEPLTVICHPKTIIIDENRNHVKDYDDLLDFRSPKPHERFRAYLFRRAAMWNAMWGVIRMRELSKTRLHGGYLSSDKVLLAELILRGKIHQRSERLFFRRQHSEQGWRVNPDRKTNAIWFDSTNAGRLVLPANWKVFIEYVRAVRLAPLRQSEMMLCFLSLLRWGSINLVWRPLNKALKTNTAKGE